MHKLNQCPGVYFSFNTSMWLIRKQLNGFFNTLLYLRRLSLLRFSGINFATKGLTNCSRWIITMKTITRKMLKVGRSNNGFTVLELIFSLIILIFSLMTVASISQMVTTFSSRLNTKNKVTQAKTELVSHLSLRKSWVNIVQRAGIDHPTISGKKINEELSCLKDLSGCTPGVYDLTLLDKSGKILTDPNNPLKGVDTLGVECNTFGSDDKCIYRYELSWSPVCPTSASCKDPQIKVKVALKNSSTNPSLVLNSTPYEFFIDRPKSYPPIVKQTTFATNSTHYYSTADSRLEFDPSPYIYSEDSSLFTITPPTGSKSLNGSDVTVSNNNVIYVPKSGFYGFDSFKYNVTDQLSGKTAVASTWVWVMTPYTWTGAGVDKKTSTAKNFCGKVINGSCDGNTFPTEDRHYIFSKYCSQCEVEMNSSASTLEMDKYFAGKVSLVASNLRVGRQSNSNWQKFPKFHQKGGLFESNGNNFEIDGTNNKWTHTWTVNDWAFKLDDGTFNAPPRLIVTGPTSITKATSFHHNNGEVLFFNIYGMPSGIAKRISVKDVEFYNFQLGALTTVTTSWPPNGTGLGYAFTDDFIIKNDFRYYPSGASDDGIANYNALGQEVNINLYGSIFIGKSGGNHIDGTPATPVINLVGSGDQTVNGIPLPTDLANNVVGRTHLVPHLPGLRINKPAGSARITGTVGIMGKLEYVQAASFDVSNSAIVFGNTDCRTSIWKPGTEEYNEVFIAMSGCTGNLALDSDSVTINGDLNILTNSYSHYYGKEATQSIVNLKGNLIVDGGTDHDRLNRAFKIVMKGPAKAQLHMKTASAALQADIELDHLALDGSIDPNRSVELVGLFSTMRGLNTVNGNFIVSSSTPIRIIDHGWNYMTSVFNAPNTEFYDFHIDHNFLANSDLTIKGNLNIGIGNTHGEKTIASALSYRINAHKNLSIGGQSLGRLNIFMNGSEEASPTIAFPATSRTLAGLTLNLISPISYNLDGKLRLNTINVNQGTLNVNSNSVITVDNSFNTLGGTVLNQNCAIINGTKNFAGTVNNVCTGVGSEVM